MNANTELSAAQDALRDFYRVVRKLGGPIELGKKIDAMCQGKPASLTTEEADAVALALQCTVKLGNACFLNSRDQARQSGADQASGSVDMLGLKGGQLAEGLAHFN